MKSLKKFFRNKKSTLALAVFLAVLSAICSLCIGSVAISPRELFTSLTSNDLLFEKSVLLYSRIPRTLACLLGGAALSVSGAVLQKVLSNKLASPGVIGVNSGAGLGVSLCCAFGGVGGWIYSMSAFLGAVAAILTITVIAYRSKASKTTVILGGIAVGGIFSAASEAIAALNDDAAMLGADFRVGGFSDISYVKLIPAAILIIIAIALLFSLSTELDVLSMGDDTAHSLGLKTRKYKNIFYFLAALLSGAAVSFSGLLGFIGLIVPNFVKSFIGSDSNRLIWGSCLFGGAFLTFSDVLARVLFAPYEIPVGIIMSLIGGPLFIYLIIHRREGV